MEDIVKYVLDTSPASLNRIQHDSITFEAVKDRIVFRLYKTKGNEAIMEKRPHREILDLVVFYRPLARRPRFNL